MAFLEPKRKVDEKIAEEAAEFVTGVFEEVLQVEPLITFACKPDDDDEEEETSS